MKNLKIRTKNLKFALVYHRNGAELNKCGYIPVKRSVFSFNPFAGDVYRNVITNKLYPYYLDIMGPTHNRMGQRIAPDKRDGVNLVDLTIDNKWATKDELKEYCKFLNQGLKR